jgi:hypothetical protein
MNPHKGGKSSLKIGISAVGTALAFAIAPASALGAPAAVDQYTEQFPQGPGGTGRGQQVTTPRDGNAQRGDQGESPGSVPGPPGAGGGDPGADPGTMRGGGSVSSVGQASGEGSSQGPGLGPGAAAGSEPVSESRDVDSKTLPLGDYPSSSFVTALVVLAVAALLIAAGLGIRARFRQAGLLRG